jgi:predicted ATP-dependent endonuclease of OLD family
MEDDLSLVIGKNNCGKTSLLCILDKFIGKKAATPTFTYDDFNIDFQKDLEAIYTTDKYQEIITEFESVDDNKWKNIGLSLKLFIEFTETDSLTNISKLMMDLDPDNKTIVLLFEYILDEENFKKIRGDFLEYKLKKEKEDKEESEEKKIAVQEDGNENKTSNDKVERKGTLFNEFMKRNSRNYFKPLKKSIAFDAATKQENDVEYINIVDEKISLLPIINFNIIPANREISNKDSDKTLSFLASEYYKRKEETEQDSPEIKSFKDKLEETDVFLDSVYAGIFEKVVNKVEQFGGVKKGDSIISIVSTLQHRELLKGNTTVMYDHNENCSLPENYNGLGYLNLISMIFDIELLINDFRRGNSINEEPADINLLFIEEPEAHTHPQMQYVFIKNIKDILKGASEGKDEKGVKKFQLQTFITSHSSHITSESKFDDIKYFFKIENNNEVIAKNLKDLKAIYGKAEAEYFKFLKQYLTLHRAELFFADKAIFIEGDTERILLPAMMKKIDQEDKNKGDKSLLLLSQNISIIEVGAYSHIFEKFFDFIGLKSLVITDLDATKQVVKDGKTIYEKCKVEDADAKYISNASLKYFYSSALEELEDDKKLNYFKSLSFTNKQLKKNTEDNKWIVSSDGHIAIIYQTKEKNSKDEDYCARSFEDAFFHLNRQFIIDNKIKFKSLKNISLFEDAADDSYDLADKCVDKKPSFAMEILLNSKADAGKNEFSNWQIPAYIKEGLSWLKKN